MVVDGGEVERGHARSAYFCLAGGGVNACLHVKQLVPVAMSYDTRCCHGCEWPFTGTFVLSIHSQKCNLLISYVLNMLENSLLFLARDKLSTQCQ